MTVTEARAALSAKYPGKMFYISCHYWTRHPSCGESPSFAVCVYDVWGSDNASGSGGSLQEAVAMALNAQPPVPKAPPVPPGILDAEAMFGHAAVCGDA